MPCGHARLGGMRACQGSQAVLSGLSCIVGSSSWFVPGVVWDLHLRRRVHWLSVIHNSIFRNLRWQVFKLTPPCTKIVSVVLQQTRKRKFTSFFSTEDLQLFSSPPCCSKTASHSFYIIPQYSITIFSTTLCCVISVSFHKKSLS